MMELDVYKTVCDILCADDAFWESEYFQQSLEDGYFLTIDYPFFVKALLLAYNDRDYDIIEKGRLSDIIHSFILTISLRDMVSEFVLTTFNYSPEDILNFVHCLTSCLDSLEKWSPTMNKASMATCMIGKAKFTKIDDLLCVNAFLTQSCQVRKLLDSDSIDRSKASNAISFVENIEPASCCYTRTDIHSYALKNTCIKDSVTFVALKSFMWYSAILDITKTTKVKKAVKKLKTLLSTTDYEPIETNNDNDELYLLEGVPRKKRKSSHSHKHHKHEKEDAWAEEIGLMFGGTDEVNFEAIKFAWEIKLHGALIKFSLNDAADTLQQKFIEEYCEELNLF